MLRENLLSSIGLWLLAGLVWNIREWKKEKKKRLESSPKFGERLRKE